MVDREIINEMLPGSTILEGPEFDGGIIGYTDEGNIVYGYESLVNSLAESWQKDYDTMEDAYTAAVEWIDYNTLRAIPYMPDPKPIVIQEFPK